jgi:hypothetical protein
MVMLGSSNNRELEQMINGSKIDLSKIRDKRDLASIPDELLYDESKPKVELELREGLTQEEIEDALGNPETGWSGWKSYARGLMIVLGKEGSGKTMFMHMLGFKLNRYFNMTVVTDTLPRKLFDLYSGYHIPFSEEFLVEQADRIWEVANRQVKFDKDRDPDLPVIQPHVTADGKWVSSRGNVLIQDAVMMMDEFGKKYMNRREPNNPIHRDLLYKVLPDWRHLNSLIIGATPLLDMIDPMCNEKVTCEAHCERAIVYDSKGRVIPDSLVIQVHLRPRRSISTVGEYDFAPQDEYVMIDANEPKSVLQGKCWKDIYNHRQAVGFEMSNSIRKKYKKQRQ